MTPMTPLRVGMVGCGDVAHSYYLPAARRFDEFQLVACADAIEERARGLAGEAGIEAMTIDRLMQRDDVDVIVNLTPPAVHRAVSLAAIAAGKHVYSEKPLAPDPDGAA